MPSRQASLPRRLENPATGHRLEIVSSPLHGDDGPLIFRCDLPAASKGSPLHRHGALTETFAVTSGQLTIGLGSDGERRLETGEWLTIAPGRVHGFRNASSRPVAFEGVVTPGEGFEKFLRVMYGLAADGAVREDGSPIDWRSLALALGYGDIILPAVPVSLQRAVLGALREAGRQAGLERDFDAYFPQAEQAALAGAAQ